MTQQRANTSAQFGKLNASLTAKAESLAANKAQAARAKNRREGTHWRSAPYLWPLFGSGG
jgi:hypothetical protein